MTNQAEEELRRVNRALRTLSECHQILFRAVEESTLLKSICELLVSVGGYRMAWVGYRVDDEFKSVRPAAHFGFAEGYLESINITWADSESGRGPTGAAIRTGKSVVCRDFEVDSNLALWREEALRRGYESSVALPIRLNGNCLGALSIYSERADAFDSAELRLLTELSDDLAYGIQALRTSAEQRRAEEDLSRSQEELQSVLASIPDYLWSADIDSQGRVTYRYYSPVVEKITGRPPAFYMPGPDRWLSTIHPDDRPRLLAAVKSISTGQLPFLTEEYRIILPDDTVRWVRDSVQVRRVDNGIRVDGVVSDITERKEAEEALRQSEAKLREALLAAQMGVWEWTIASDTITWDENFERIAGRDPNLLVPSDQMAPKIITPESWERLKAAGGNALATGTSFELDMELVRPDGSTRWLIGRGEPVRDMSGRITHLRGTVQDITERKRAEAEHARLVTAVEQSAEAVVITNTNGDIEYVNPAFTSITGYRREEVLGRNPRILKSDRQDLTFYHQLWATISDGQPWHGELINRRKDGMDYVEEMNITPVRDASGKVIHYIATKQDVTERKALQVRFQQAAKMEAVGRLAGGVAHDFNNHLTVINGYCELLMDKFRSDKEAGAYLKEVKDAGERAASLTRQLLAFSRLQVLAPQVLDLNDVVSNVEKMLRRLIGEDLKLRTVLAPSLWQVKADRGQIEQVIMNLVVNARDAMPHGGEIVIETANVELDSDYARIHPGSSPGPYMMLAVSDTGIGMSAETQAHVFEPFFTTKEQGKGTGLGLAMVYGTVKQSGGYIWVLSEPGQGTTFRIYLPRVDEVKESIPVSHTPEHLVAGTETILLVEDEEGVRVLAARILQRAGYQVLESTTAEDAFQIGERHAGPIELLLADVVLPGTNGRKVAERLALLRPDMKILYMSGYADDSIVRRGLLETNMAFLQKPFTPTSLARKVREVLDAGRKKRS